MSDAAIAALTERYRASLSAKRAAILMAAADWRSAPGDRDRLRALAGPLHKLAGSAGAYGFARLGAAARIADGLIADALEVSAEAADRDTGPVLELTPVLREIDELFSAEINGNATAVGSGAAPPCRLQVLLVDDDVEIAALLSEQLGREGIKVTVVHDGSSMHRALAVSVPDVLLLDYWLQAETGAELATMVHAQTRYASLPTLCLTTDHSLGTRRCALGAGALEVVDKSLPSAELARLLRQLARPAAPGHPWPAQHLGSCPAA